MANLKAHLIAGTIIVVIAFAAIALFDSTEVNDSENADYDKYFIQVFSATYGGNCDGSEEYEKKSESGVRKKVTVSIKRNNRLGLVSELCNEETSCGFQVNNKTLGKAKTYGCSPALMVKYRCFRMDKLQRARANENSDIKIDCRQDTVEKRLNSFSNKSKDNSEGSLDE